jgi:glycosyltransferase involved in cell wall biosynthesis
MEKSISVVIPVFRSAATLRELYRRLESVLSNLTDHWEIILVDDASNDGTFAAMLDLRNLDDRVKLVRFSYNMGQHNATLCGLTRAVGDYVFTLDDDLQNPPEEIPNFINKMNEGYDLVIGRIVGGKRHSWWRNIASTLMQSLVSHILEKPKDLTLSPMKCMSRRTLKGVTSFTGRHVYIPALLFRSTPHDRICNIPVAHHPRLAGRGNYTLSKLFRLASFLVINYSRLPLRLVTAWGLFLSVASIAFATYTVIRSLIYGNTHIGWPSLAVLISFLSGNILLCVGVLGEYIGRLVDESYRNGQFPIFEERS